MVGSVEYSGRLAVVACVSPAAVSPPVGTGATVHVVHRVASL